MWVSKVRGFEITSQHTLECVVYNALPAAQLQTGLTQMKVCRLSVAPGATQCSVTARTST
jgi:hypothetical protein